MFSSTYPNAETAAAERHADRYHLSGELLPELALFDSATPVVSIPGHAPLSALLTAALAVPPTPALP